MQRILQAGATGGLGQYVLKHLKDKGFFVRALVRNDQEIEQIKGLADASKPESLTSLFDQIDIVFSSIGKNLSLFSDGDHSFFEVDDVSNCHLIDQAQKR